MSNSSDFAGASQPLHRLLRDNLGVAAFIIALLECWRPLYFLTDDNLDAALPLFTGIGRRLLRGESPFISNDLFGGHYNLLRDASCTCWHPLYLVAALITQTPLRFLAIDFAAICLLLLADGGFVCLADFARREFRLPLGDARLMLCTQSFTFSMLALCAGASWLTFLANNSALPWLALGILQPEWRRGFLLAALFSAHQILGGYPAATLSSTLFLTLFALGVAWQRRSFAPLAAWLGGVALVVLVLSPLLLSMSQGFTDTSRAAGLDAATMDKYSFPARLLPCSWFLGIFSWFLGTNYHFGFCPPYYAAALAGCAAAWVLLPALLSRARWSGLEELCLALVVLAALFVVRPEWLGQVLIHIPVLRAMRWPFRELLQLLFFLHVFLVLRPLGGSPPVQRVLIFSGIFLFVCPLFFLPAPSFNAMTVDRGLIRSAAAARYWMKVGTLLRPGEVIVPVVAPNLSAVDWAHAPLSLIGAYDYPELFAIPAATGYTLTVPRDQLYLPVPPWLDSGIYAPAQEAAIAKARPNVRFITLESVLPLRITLSSPDGPINLAAFQEKP